MPGMAFSRRVNDAVLSKGKLSWSSKLPFSNGSLKFSPHLTVASMIICLCITEYSVFEGMICHNLTFVLTWHSLFARRWLIWKSWMQDSTFIIQQSIGRILTTLLAFVLASAFGPSRVKFDQYSFLSRQKYGREVSLGSTGQWGVRDNYWKGSNHCLVLQKWFPCVISIRLSVSLKMEFACVGHPALCAILYFYLFPW